MKQPKPTLIQTLETRQRELGLSDGEFARRLGVSRPLWVAVRTGQRAVALQLLRGVAQAFPDLDAAVLGFLRGTSPDTTKAGR